MENNGILDSVDYLWIKFTQTGAAMNKLLRLLIIAAFFMLSGCYPGISGKVVDGVTGNPIQGAVVLAQWTMTGGLPGLSHHSVYNIEESETDMEGKFFVSGVYNPFVDAPEMVIYKKGYIPWRNDMNFMDEGWEEYKEHIWQSGLTYKLMYLPEGYSKKALAGFVRTGFMRIGSKFENIQMETAKDARKK